MTVSKTTTQEKARKWLQSSYDLACGELWHSWNDSSAADFADNLTAELQKENARLTKVLYEFFQLAAPHVGIATRSKMWAALNPPEGGEVQKGPSK